MSGRQRILVIRRDNIGDLVCTLPLIEALRTQFPQAWLGALVTAYNAEVLHANPHLDAVFHYRKAKHLGAGESTLGAMVDRLRQLWALRRVGIDTVLLPASGRQQSARRMARLIGAKRIICADDMGIDATHGHEAQRAGSLLTALGASAQELPSARLVPRTELVARMQQSLPGDGPLLGLHISARKPSQRWPAERFIALIHQLHASRPELRFALFWAPGAADNPLHPGDDDKAREIVAACQGLPVFPLATQTLAELIAGLSLLDRLLCSDGGHMHLAAALGKPIVCLFGKSDTARWHPWGVPYQLLQTGSLDVRDITVDTALQAFDALPESPQADTGIPSPVGSP